MLAEALATWHIVKERRATFACASAERMQVGRNRRPAGETSSLAGDWTATGLPATIEARSDPAMRRRGSCGRLLAGA